MPDQESIKNRIDCEIALRVVGHPILMLDAGLNIVLANRAFLSLFGLSDSDVEGKSVRDLAGPLWDSPDLRRLLDDIAGGKRDTGGFRIEDNFQRIGHRVFAVQGQVLPEECGKGRLMLLTIEDTTPTVVAIRRTEMALAQLEKSNRVLAEFASFAAHDLQAPLNRISKFSDLLSTEVQVGSMEKAAHHVSTIQSQTRQMSALIRDLLRLGRVAASPDEIEDVALSSVMSEVLENLDEQISVSGAQFQFGELPVVKGRRSQLRQLFINLVDNAIRYRKSDGNVLIRIEARLCEGGVEILVRDNGIGFPTDQAEEIFKPFRRLQDNREPGTGLGLSICRRIIEALGGSIRAEGAPGQGATFAVRFPSPQV